MTTLLEALKSAQFVTDTKGQQVAIQIQPAVWQALVTWLESTNGGPSFEEIKQRSETTQRESMSLAHAATHLSEHSFSQVWNNPEDDVYNDL
ncbi:MAG: hypothetical protein AAFZ17_21400 [Cyanobacteria bacterium J06650_10]